MRSEELKLVKRKAASRSKNYALRIKHYAFATMNSSLSDRRERSLLTLTKNLLPPTSYLLPIHGFSRDFQVFRIFPDLADQV